MVAGASERGHVEYTRLRLQRQRVVPSLTGSLWSLSPVVTVRSCFISILISCVVMQPTVLQNSTNQQLRGRMQGARPGREQSRSVLLFILQKGGETGVHLLSENCLNLSDHLSVQVSLHWASLTSDKRYS